MMLQINLRPGQKRKAGASGKAMLASLKEMFSKVSDPLLAGAVGVWALVLLGLGFAYVTSAAQLHGLKPRLEDVRAENMRFKALMAQKRKAEQIRDSLVRQLNVIRTVDGDRYVWPHVLDEVAKALPSYTWLTELAIEGAGPAGSAQAAAAADTSASDSTAAPPPIVFRITGRTVDIQAYTRFLRQLEASPWIGDVTTISAQTVVEAERPVTAFTLRARFAKADSAYIRTVPLSQMVR